MAEEEFNKFLLEYIERSKRDFEKCLDYLGNVPPERLPIIYSGAGLDAETIAVHALLLGNRDEALKWFRKSSESYYLQAESQRSLTGTCSWEGEMGRCEVAFDMAVLSGDHELINKCIRQSLGICAEYPEKYPDFANSYFYLVAFTRYLNDELELARDALYKIRIVNKKHTDLCNGRRVGLLGLIACDRQGLVSGLNKILTFHAKSVNSKMPYHLISIDATVLIKIAREKDIIVKPEDINKGLEKYVPWNLFK